MRETPTHNLELLTRACQTRATTDQSNCLEKARATPCLYTCSLDVSARHGKIAPEKQGKRGQTREARLAEVEIRTTTVTLRPPYRFDRRLPEVTVNVVLVEEPHPPEGCEPIQWVLITTLPIADSEQVQKIVTAYCVRWQIEIFFKTLKTGCRVEQRQFETLDRMLNCLAVYSIVAWRIMYLCRLGRECPDLSCEVVFEPCEWKAVYTAVMSQATSRVATSTERHDSHDRVLGRLCHPQVHATRTTNALDRPPASSRPVHRLERIWTGFLNFFS